MSHHVLVTCSGCGGDDGGVTVDKGAKPLQFHICVLAFVSVKPLDILDEGPWRFVTCKCDAA